MEKAVFPQRREDGSLSVASRFSVYDATTVRRVEDYVTGWIHGIAATNHVNLLEDLAVAPYVVAGEGGIVDVIFDGRPESRRWKDWMVYLTRDLESTTLATFVCFYDRVADAPHPASVRRSAPPP
jgi:hypothetical protein